MSENQIFSIINKDFKNDSFFGEETGQITNKGDYKWIIDPLDGTVNYTHGIPIYSISIALFYKNKCVAGIIFNPSSDEMFYGSLNQGSYCNGNKLEVSKETNLKKSLIFVIIYLLKFEIKKKFSIYQI